MAKDKTEGSGPISLLDALAGATADDLAAVRTKIAECESSLHSLRQVERILDVKLNGIPERKPMGPRKAKSPSITATGLPKGALTDKYRRDAAHLLMGGPRRIADIAEECGIPNGSITGVLAHPWFAKNPDGGVHITNMGRQQIPA